MSESERLAGFRAARERFDHVVRDMERFILNLDPNRGQALRDWLRAVAGDRHSDRASAPPLRGWPLAEQIGEHLETVLAARTVMRKAWRLLGPTERDGLALPPGLR